MKQTDIQTMIEAAFKKQLSRDSRIKTAFLLVHSDKLNMHFSLAEGSDKGRAAHIGQPLHLASVGKVYTATLISLLVEKGLLAFDDPIVKYLDRELSQGLHVFRGNDYTDQISIRHLLMQTSGLNDVFYHLWKKFVSEAGFSISAREAVLWGKQHLRPVAEPGKRHFYTDTNYYLLGFIIEKVLKMPFHEAMHEFIFKPLGMKHAFMFGFSQAEQESLQPPARLYIKGVDVMAVKGVHEIDHAGGSVMAPLDDHLRFMKALTGQRIISAESLERMLNDDIYMGFPTVGFNYGYSIWKMKSIPLLMPKSHYSWGGVGVTGAFMFYHPLTESIIIGTFNDFAYRGKALDFMARKVIRPLLRPLQGQNS